MSILQKVVLSSILMVAYATVGQFRYSTQTEQVTTKRLLTKRAPRRTYMPLHEMISLCTSLR